MAISIHYPTSAGTRLIKTSQPTLAAFLLSTDLTNAVPKVGDVVSFGSLVSYKLTQGPNNVVSSYTPLTEEASVSLFNNIGQNKGVYQENTPYKKGDLVLSGGNVVYQWLFTRTSTTLTNDIEQGYLTFLLNGIALSNFILDNLVEDAAPKVTNYIATQEGTNAPTKTTLQQLANLPNFLNILGTTVVKVLKPTTLFDVGADLVDNALVVVDSDGNDTIRKAGVTRFWDYVKTKFENVAILKKITNVEINAYTEPVISANSGLTFSIDFTSANVYNIVLTNNCTFSFTNPPTSARARSVLVYLRQDSLGGHLVTWPNEVDNLVVLGTEPDSYTILTILTIDGGNTYQILKGPTIA